MAQYTQRTQPMHRPGQTDHGHGGGALAYGGKPPAGAVVAPPQPRPTGAPYAPQPYQPAQLRLHQPGYGSAALSYRDSSYVRGGGAVSEYRGGGGVGGRVSLLPAAYMPPPAPAAHHPPPADPPPFKKIRLTAERPPPTPLPHHQPIRVDTREPVNQYNTVEVLSPNPPSESNVEDQTFRTTKDELLQQISKVDREMALSESALAKLKKKQVELEQTATKPAKAEEPEETPTHHRSLPQCIYAENRKKAATAHGVLSHLGPPVLYPLYNQPQDTEVYHENIRKHRLFRKRLADHIRRIKLEAEKREDLLAEEYTKRAAEWARRVERIEQSQKRKTKDARNREFFEKVFPELRKQREERERFNRLGARVKSEAELEEIADGLHEQEHEDKKMRSLTVVPPLLRDPRDTRPIYIDTNSVVLSGRCMDMKSEHKELQLRNIWTQAEKDIFREKYLQHPKNFGQIASFLPRKTVRDCVRFYYLSKKAENYKQLLRKPRQRRNPRKMVEPELPAGVTTRLQRSQGRVSDAKEGGTEENVVQAPDPSLIPIPPAAPAHPVRTELIRTPPLPPSPPPASSAPLAPVTSTPTSTSINIIPLSGNLLPVPTAGCSARTELIRTPPLPPSPPPASSAPLAPVTSTPTSTSLSIISIIPPPGSPSPTPTPVPPPTPPLSTPSSVEAAMPVTSAEVTLTVTPITTSSVSTTSSSSMSAYVTTSTSASVSVTAAVSASGSAPPTPQPAQPPTPTQPPPTPEAVVIERTATPSSTATSTTTTVGTTSSPLDMVCAVCNVSGATRTVSRTRAVHYGLKEDAVGARVCEACHCRCVRSRYTRCPVPTCPGPRVRAKRLRHLPPRWHDLSTELKRPLMEEFQIPSELSKCCLACFKRITRRLETVGEGGSAPEPTDEEASRFRSLLREHGTAWDRIAAVSGRTPASLKAFYFTYRKKLQLEQAVCERGPPAAASGVRCSSSDESCVSSGDTDTASGGSPARGALPPQAPPPPVVPRRSHGSSNVASHATRDDYDDSSATETADEENDAPSAKQINLPPTSIPLPTTIPPSSSSASAPSPTPATVTVSTISGPTSGATGVIGSSGAPAVTGVPVVTGVTSGVTGTSTVSVLGTRNGPAAPQTVRDVVLNIIEISLTRDPQPSSLKPQHLKVSSTTSTRESLATLSVVNNSHLVSSSPAPVSPQRPATITPVPHQGPAAHDKEPHAGHDGGRQERPEPLLDLRVNKRLCHEPPFPHPNKPIIRNSTESVHYTSYRAAPERDSPNQYNCKPKPPQQPPRGPLKPAQNPKGSIILGTPVEVRGQTRRTPEPKAGSITAGTPLHHLPDKRAYEPYARRSPARTYYATPTSQPRPQSPSFSPTGGGTYRSPYGIEQRQIMLADFITSQQMHGGARRERTERGSPPQFGSFPGQFSPGRRDREPVSVIQRHTPHVYPHHHPPPPPGHEAFTSLVDVASAATALPVPSGEGKPEGKHHLPHPHPHPHHQQHPHHHQQQQHQQHQQQHQQHQQQMHGMQSHDVRIRDLPTKYHQMPQYQVLDRRVSQHAPAYIERDRIAIQQRRDTERAMALQERHAMEQHQQHQQQQHQQHQQQQQQQHQQQQQQHQQQQQQQQKQHQQQQQQQHQQHQQTMIHERHHMQHTQNVVSQESDRRLATTAAYSTASGLKHRAHTPHHIDRKDGRPVVSSAGVGVGVGVGVAGNVGVGVGVGGAAVGGAEPRAGTLTAASLIDAIITHQISQTSEQRFPQQGGRDCDNGNPAPQERQDRGPTPAERDREREEHTPAHITSIKLGELASNIITRDFCSPAASMVHHNRFASGATSEAYPSAGAGATVGVMSSGAGGGQAAGGQPPTDEWKRRDPPKHAPYLEPVSPPDNHHPNRNNSNRRYSCVPGSGSGVLTAFDYVTTRIVEVMRSDADERTKQPLAFPTANYTYPFSALNVTAAPQDGSAPTTSAPSAPAPNPAPLPPPEPAPLMSAQYEPLSDED